MDQTTVDQLVNLLAGYLGDDEPSIRPLPRRVRCQPTADAIFAHVGQNLRSTNPSGALGSLTRQRPTSGGIPGIDLRARENACEAGGLTQEYRDRCPAVGHPMRYRQYISANRRSLNGCSRTRLARCFFQRVFSKSAASRSDEREN
jgi:hypothetical protein